MLCAAREAAAEARMAEAEAREPQLAAAARQAVLTELTDERAALRCACPTVSEVCARSVFCLAFCTHTTCP